MHLAITRPIPTVVTTGGVMDVTYLLNTPHDIDWKGLYVDADLRRIELVASGFIPDGGTILPSPLAGEGQGEGDRERLFMQLSSLQGSILENRIFEDDFQVESISTAKLIQISNQGTGGSGQLITIDKQNIDTILPTLPFAENIIDDIQNTINQNLTITIPEKELCFEDWTGIGYIKEDPETGESGWMLSGVIAGGMTALSSDRWPETYAEIFSNSSSEPPNEDPESAFYILKNDWSDRQEGTAGSALPVPLQVTVYDRDYRPVKGAEVAFTIKAGGGTFSNNAATLVTATNYKGIASAALILGGQTSENPVYLSDPAGPHSQQVGANIVDAALASGLNLSVPFTEYGYPGEAADLRKLSGDNLSGPILFMPGFVSVIVEDALGNPIVNHPVTFKIESPAGTSKPAYLIPSTESCIWDAPLWGECGETSAREMEILGSAKGIQMQVMLGSAPGAVYTTTAESTILKQTVTFQSSTYPDSGNTEFYLFYGYVADQSGYLINAGKAGTTIPLQAKALYVKDGEARTDFDALSVTFDGNPGTAIKNPDGSYSGLLTHDHPLTLGLNRVKVKADAVIAGETRNQWVEILVYGVKITTDPLPPILVDADGYATKDYEVRYTIQPTGHGDVNDYEAGSAYVMIYKDRAQNPDPIANISTETTGKGFGTISRGFHFDMNSDYAAQVVLNYGTAVEIRGEEIKFAVANIEVSNDEDTEEQEEIRFGDGGRADRKYHIELQSRTLTESCDGLTGKIRVVDAKGVPITVPDEEKFYPYSYMLDFTLQNKECLVNVKDYPNNLIKEKFILSNLPKEALESRQGVDLANILPLYGGIGNQVEIEINGAKKHIAIEPVGVILIGIDGLRQDVLYPQGSEDVHDPTGNYSVNLVQMPGLGQILEGYQRTEDQQQYIMLPHVTAIFPSITFASWASIFTGKLPEETGILGNEFFARDRYSPTGGNDIPGLGALPSGMVTFSDGAFDNGSDKSFALNHVTPAEFPPYYYKILQAKLANSAPGDVIQTSLFWEEIGNMVNASYHLSPIENQRCDESEYECRSVSVLNQYAEGVDRWVTPGVTISFDVAELMDKAAADEAVDFVNDYFSKENPDGKRKRFPALFSVYFAGLDHEAHMEGMGAYDIFFQYTTDPQIARIVTALKTEGEFDNKIFIITADHGHTGMADPSQMILSVPVKDEAGQVLEEKYWYGEASCELNLEKFNTDKVKYQELANHNLHIWELAEALKVAGEESGLNYTVLAPEQIAKLFKDKNQTEPLYGATSDVNKANVIAAFNGPMAHIYLKGNDGWQAAPDATELEHLALVFKRMFQEAGANLDEDIQNQFTRLLSSVDTILIRPSLGSEYEVYAGDITKFVNAIDRIKSMNNPMRSGDIVLIMKDDMNDVDQRFSTGISCRSWHGSLNRSDSYVPLIVAYPGGNKYELSPLIDNTAGCNSMTGCDGNWRVTDMIREAIKNQYLDE